MSNSDMHEHNLVHIPSDIIRRIYKMELESLDTLRMISPRWNTLAVEHLSDRRNLPVIKFFHVYIIPFGQSVLSTQVPFRFLQFLGLRNWHQSSDGKFVTVSKRFEEGVRFDCLVSRLFLRCSHIRKLEIRSNDTEKITELSTLRIALGDVRVHELVFAGLRAFNSLDNDDSGSSARRILDFIEHCNVDHLVIPTYSYSLPTIGGFLAEAAKFVSTVVVETTTAQLRHTNTFDEEQREWSELAADMNSRLPIQAQFEAVKENGRVQKLRMTIMQNKEQSCVL